MGLEPGQKVRVTQACHLEPLRGKQGKVIKPEFGKVYTVEVNATQWSIHEDFLAPLLTTEADSKRTFRKGDEVSIKGIVEEDRDNVVTVRIGSEIRLLGRWSRSAITLTKPALPEEPPVFTTVFVDPANPGDERTWIRRTHAERGWWDVLSGAMISWTTLIENVRKTNRHSLFYCDSPGHLVEVDLG